MRGTPRGAFARSRSSGARRGSSIESSATTADANERDAHASATSPSRSTGCSASSAASPGWASTARSTSMRAVRASAERSIAASRSGLAERVVPPVMQAVSRILTACLGSVVAAAQLNLVVGDLEGNVARILDAYERADAAGCDLVAFPELSLTGYPPEDLLLRPSFVAQRGRVAREVRRPHRSPRPRWSASPRPARDLYNAAAVCAHGQRAGRLPQAPAAELRGVRRAALLRAVDRRRPAVRRRRACGSRVTICEDAWSPNGPITTQAAGGAELVVNINASPYYAGPAPRARDDARARAPPTRRCRSLYVNLVGGQDELVFDGASMLFDESGHLVARGQAVRRRPARSSTSTCAPRSVGGCSTRAARAARAALPEVAVSERAPRRAPRGRPHRAAARPGARGLRGARARHARLRAARTAFTDVFVGLSGGIDSSLVAAIAADALGPEHVTGVLMPSRFSSEGSVTDAEALADNLGHPHAHRSRSSRRTPRSSTCWPSRSTGPSPGLAEENLQARIRGTDPHDDVATSSAGSCSPTGNKSEMATGYSTLYGDMAGGFAVIKDVPKMLVYALARDRNERAGRALIPDVVLEKPPSAELRPDQKDSDSLPDVRDARPDRRGLRRGRPLDRRARGGRATTPTPCGGSRVSSTATSTSAARRRPACGCRRRRSARTVVCRSPTAGPASSPLRHLP